MKRLIAVLLLLAIAIPAQAAWNIRQKDNGSTVWVNPDGIEVPAGDSGIIVRISDLSAQITHFAISHKAGKIKKVYGIAQTGDFAAQSAAPTMTFGIGTGSTEYFTPVSSGAVLTLVTANKGYSANVDVSSVAARFDDVAQGYVISIKVGGSAVGTVSGDILIVVE